MRAGVFIPLFDPLADPTVVARLASDAEDAGWDGFFVWDQITWRPPVMAVGDTQITLAAIAMHIDRIRFGPLVTPLARRRPAKVARETAALDLLSRGRLTLGVGLGSDHFAREFSITGEEIDDRRRAGMLDEALAILEAAWTGEPVNHRGEHYTVDGTRFLPRPIQRPRVPVWVAGLPGNARPLRRAIRYDGYVSVNLDHPDQLADMVDRLVELRTDAGRNSDETFEVVAALDPGTDTEPYGLAGATWWLLAIPSESISIDKLRGVIRDGPASHHDERA
jgi:alkanesulfonate monooxygenase SsuD/methylene tetrahydromethanopterin reductase-like flavin-dependent oxidoreductase (luciferase family)